MRSSVGEILERQRASGMDDSSHHWFVQTDFGALLGPMPGDTLAEMARTGALLVRDQVREGTDGEWRSAGEVPGLFDEQTPSLGLLTSTLEDIFAPQAASSHDSVASKRVSHSRSTRSDFKSSASVETSELAFETDAPLIVPPATVLSVLNVNTLKFDVDVPLLAPQKSSSFPATVMAPPSVTNLPAHAVSALPSPTPSAMEAPVNADVSAPVLESPSRQESEAVFSTPPGWQSGTSTASRWQPTTRRSARKFRFDKQTALRCGVAAFALALLIAAWSLWPSQRQDLFVNYSSIYKELQNRRDDDQDFAGWTEFVARATTQLDESLPWLEGRAVPGDREKSLLLYAGRDLREFVNLPRTARNPHQKRLDVFFEQLTELYAGK